MLTVVLTILADGGFGLLFQETKGNTEIYQVGEEAVEFLSEEREIKKEESERERKSKKEKRERTSVQTFIPSIGRPYPPVKTTVTLNSSVVSCTIEQSQTSQRTSARVYAAKPHRFDQSPLRCWRRNERMKTLPCHPHRHADRIRDLVCAIIKDLKQNSSVVLFLNQSPDLGSKEVK